MQKSSALIDGNTCPELCGDTDKFGSVYAGPRCNGCDQCEGLEAIKFSLRSALPYKPCFIPGHEDHQMSLCGGCGNNGFRKGQHWYCPQLTYKSGEHVSPIGAPATIEEDIPDEALV